LTLGDGVVYLASTTKAFAIYTADGTIKWEYEHQIPRAGLFGTGTASDVLHAPPALSDNVVYFGSDEGYLLAVDATTGAQKWEFPPPVPTTFIPFIKERPAPVFAGLAVAGNRVIFAGTDNKVYAVDAVTGKLVWEFAVGSHVWATPLVANNTVYIGTLGHRLIALDAETGELRWTFDQPKGALAGKPVLSGDVIYVGSFDGHLYAVDAQSGSLRWSFNANNWVWSGPAVVGDTLYLGDLGGNVYALDAATQKFVWQPFQAGGAVRATPLYSDGVLYVGTDNGALYALDAATGKERWAQPFRVNNAHFLTTPVMQSGLLLVAPLGTPTLLYALDPSNGQIQWQFPEPTSK
jgi:outer membrane protein assembly factor BamB